MDYLVSDLKEDVRIAMDRNNSSDTLAGFGDVDTLSIDEIIESKIEHAARIVELDANPFLLDRGEAFGDSIGWDSQAGYGSGRIHLPDDFLRLVVFQMSDWDMAVTEPIDESSPFYALQKSRYPGIKGNPQKPVVAIVQEPIGLVLEFYSCTSGNAFIKKARYIPIPRIKDGNIWLCEKLKEAVVYYTAYLTALSLGAADLASALLPVAMKLMGVTQETSE